MRLESKLPDVGTNIFTVMSAMAREHGAINLSQGFPNFDVDPVIIELLAKHALAGQNQYSPMPGQPALREAIARKIELTHHVSVDPNTEITITAGATQALYTAIGAVIRPGDNAIIFDPAYDSYAPAVLSYGGTVTDIPLLAPDFKVDWDLVESKVSPATRMIIINTPHNPLGRALTRADMTRLSEISNRHDLLVLSDEVYEHLIFDGLEHESALRLPELRSRTFAVYSFGKTFHATGWKTGYCVAPPDLTIEFRKMHQFVTFAVHTPTQLAYADYLQDPEHYLSLPGFFQKKRDMFKELMAGSSFDFLPCEGSYFILADYSAISDLDDMAFASWLTKEHGVATIPLSPFYKEAPDQKIVRFCFAKTEETLTEAAARLNDI